MQRVSDEIFVKYFSPHSPHTIFFDGILFPTAEHAYHYSRYKDPEIRKEILKEKSPLLAWQVSQKYKDQQIKGFSDLKRDIMKKILFLKMQQNKEVRSALIESGNLKIVKHIVSGPKADGYWDDGDDGTGRNEIGKIWMEIRDGL